MISLSFDLSYFEAAAKQLNAAIDQVPFALAQTLNQAADATRERLATETWPRGVMVRNQSFMKAALTTKGERANKRKLSVAIYDRLNRASLTQHERGGTKQAKRNLAVPSSTNVQPRRSGRGVPPSLRPSGLKNSFRRGDAIYQRGPGKKHKAMKLMYVVRPSAQIKGTVRFHADFERFMRMQMASRYPEAIRKAMATRRR